MNKQDLSPADRNRLRSLASHQMELAQLPCMTARPSEWTRHNDLLGDRPMVTVEIRTFEDELLPTLQCVGTAAQIERKLLATIAGYECTLDDRIVPDYYSVTPAVELQMFSIPMLRHYVSKQSFSIEPVITDLPAQLDSLQPSTFFVNRMEFEAEQQLAEEAFGDLLPVRLQCPPLGVFLSKHLVELMGMEEMMYAFYDSEQEMRALITRIADEYLRFFDWLEQESLLLPNNDNTLVKMGTVGYTDRLPGSAELSGSRVLTTHLWGHLNSQETSSVSSEMFNDFFLEQYARVAKRFGLYTYGCCEPVDRLWQGGLDRMPAGLRKLSISPWCNQEVMGEQLRGTDIIFHRKPSPNFIGVGTALDADAFTLHIRETLQAARGCKLEFSMRDIYSLGNNPQKVRQAVELVRSQIEMCWQP